MSTSTTQSGSETPTGSSSEAPETGATTETVSPTSTTEATTETGQSEGETPTDWKAQAEHWQAQAREQEKRAKANVAAARELEELRAAGQTDQEKAIADARAEGERTATAKGQLALFGAEVRAAAAGRVADPNVLDNPAVALGLLQLDAPPTTDDGLIDVAAVRLAIDELLKRSPSLAAVTRPAPGSADGGGRTGTSVAQLTRDDLRNMTPEAIETAKNAGQLDQLLGRL